MATGVSEDTSEQPYHFEPESDQEQMTNVSEWAATVVSIPPGVTKTFVFKPIEGQYVNIVIPGRSEYLTLCEVEVFAD